MSGLASVLFRMSHPIASQTLVVALTLLSVLATIFVCRYLSGNNGPESREQAWEAPFALVVLLGVLSSPHLYSHDWVVLVPAAVYLQGWVRSGEAPSAGRRRAFFWLLAGSPFVFTFSHFIGWSPGGLIQWIPWYMGAVAGIGILRLRTATLRQAEEASATV